MNTIYQVDAFTSIPFKGNPAGVMIVDEHFPAEKMQQLAMEMNLSESAFIIPNGNEFRIRYFTPNREVPLCGHATLASAHIIYELGLKKEDESIVFKAEGGNLSVSIPNKPYLEFKKAGLEKIVFSLNPLFWCKGSKGVILPNG